MQNQIENRSPALVVVLGIVTCGLYLIYWYYKVYGELVSLRGKTPTGNSFGLDFLLTIVTCGIWGVYVDYRISLEIAAAQKDRGMTVMDTAELVIILDVIAYLSFYFTGIISSAIQQDALNKFTENASGGATPGSSGPSSYTYIPPQKGDGENPYS